MTGYRDRSLDAKAVVRLDENMRLVLGHQTADLDDAWRTHKTIFGVSWHGTTVGSEKRRVLDNDRSLTYLQFHAEKMGGIIDTVRASVSWHLQEEEQDRVKSNDSSDLQGFETGTLGGWVQLETPTSFGRFTYGAEWYHDNVNSFKTSFSSAGVPTVKIQGPVADDASYDLGGVYLQAEIPLGEAWRIIAGARFTYAEADARKVEDPIAGGQISLKENWTNVSGSLRALYSVTEKINLYAGVSQGFRAPNLSDLTRLDTARSNEIETPAPGLDPEKYIAFELGAKALFDRWEAEVAVFYTLIDDMIIRRPTGNIIGGDEEVTKANSGEGYLWGFELGARYRISEDLSVFGSFVYLRGEADQFPTSAPVLAREPLSQMMPATGILGVRWAPKGGYFWIEGLVAIVNDQDRLSSRDKSDTQRIPPGGTPGYTTYALRGGYRPTEYLTASVSVENISNKDYRVHGSGVNEAGTNFVVSAAEPSPVNDFR